MRLARLPRLTLLAVGVACLLTAHASGAPAAAKPGCAGSHWVRGWMASPSFGWVTVRNLTLRVVVTPSVGGRRLRVRVSNRFGDGPLALSAVSVSRRGAQPAAIAGPNPPVTFARRSEVTIPRGDDAVSDPVRLRFGALEDLLVSVHLRRRSPALTASFSMASETASYAGMGDLTGERSGAAFASSSQAVFLVTGVDVVAPRRVRTVVALGDSITRGHGSAVGLRRGEHAARWPDFLARRLHAGRAGLAVANAGIAGNRILLDAPPELPLFGPRALARLNYDVLHVPGVSDVIVLLGSNDIGHEPHQTARDVVAGLDHIVRTLHAAGRRVLVGTITPDEGNVYSEYAGSPAGDAVRRDVNRWIRTARSPHGIVDFDAALRDPGRPSRLRRGYDSGDHLHPNARGYERMAQAVDLRLLRGSRC